MSSLQGKRVLFFAPKFFNYEIAIKEELERQGAEVHLYDERGNPSSLEKILIRKCPTVLKSKIYKYYNSIIQKESNFSPDYIFFLSPETATKDCIKLLKEKFYNAKFILYMYDSLKNKNAKYIYKYFDRYLSFDPNDCKEYGFIFRPLFFMNSFESNNSEKNYKYDFCFIGSIHSDRAKILYKLKKYFEENGYSYFYYLYIPGKLMLCIRWLLNKYVRRLRKQYIHTTSIEKRIVSEISESTKYVIDINHPKQVGLTMRTIEMLGLQRKILTTNQYIKDYDFYKPNNQIIVSRRNIEINSENITDKYEAVEKEVYDSYKLKSWVEKVFDV